MGQGASRNIILTGFSYTGKTKVGLAVAATLGWRYVDTDEEVVRLSGRPIADIFARDGEDRFRELERETLREVCSQGEAVISTGGGAFMFEANRELMLESGVVVCLEAQPATIYRRLLKDAEESPEQEVRPLLAGAEPLKRIEELKRVRQPFYALADWTVHTDSMTVEEAAQEVIHGWRRVGSRECERAALPSVPETKESDAPYCQELGAAAVVRTATECYPIFVEWGALDQLGKRMRNAGLQGRVHVVSDDQVFPLYGESVRKVLEEAGFAVDDYSVPKGESSKSFDVAVAIYDWLVERRAERGDTVLALGGGVVGDLAGFVAATFLRGIPLVQVPTSLVGMVDSSIGGKVGVNHPRGKNLIGAFYQPRLVVADIRTLSSLPRRELVSGWAEVIKHAMIRDPRLLRLLEERGHDLLALDEGAASEVVARSAAIKAEVVSADERESGLRTILNYGHTIAHGLEAATGYERFLHGEAVAIGMVGAARISHSLGMLAQETVERQERVLRAFGLPTSCTGIDAESVLRASQLDKKVRGERIRWVLLSEVGTTVIRGDVPDEVVETEIRRLVGPDDGVR
jgi:3-dehydroquinate synthase